MPSRAIIVISSHVARGSVGNRVMVFALERLGFDVWAVPTIVLPHHPGHGPVDRIVPEDEKFAGLLQALIKGDRATEVAAIVSGYLATEAQAAAVVDLVNAVKAARPDAIYVCDPVIGDQGSLYVAHAVARAIRDKLLPIADVATPNAFECAWLGGQAEAAEPDYPAIARALPPETVLVSFVPAMVSDQIGNLLVSKDEAVLFEHPLVATIAKGTGDLLTALFAGRRLEGRRWSRAAEMAVASVYDVVAGTAKAGADELMIAQLQTSLLQPKTKLGVRRLDSGRS